MSCCKCFGSRAPEETDASIKQSQPEHTPEQVEVRSQSMSSTRVLKTVVFMGSARNVTPPWGGDSRLGDRVLKHVLSVLKSRKTELGNETVTHDVTVFDPKDVFEAEGPLAGDAQLACPHFFLKDDDPRKQKMKPMQEAIKAADAYLIVTAEYNHSPPPALLSMLGHFGGSNFAQKASAICTYSPGPWGGMRCAMSLQPMLHELGCLPVSKLTGFPAAGELFNEDGSPKDPEHRMLKQLPAMITDLEWVATAFAKMKETAGPPKF